MRSHYCGDVSADDIGREVALCGWVARRRDHGGVIFIDLRDYRGIVQVVFDPQEKTAFALADQMRSEYVLRTVGIVRERSQETINPDMPTGTIEVYVHELKLLNRALPPPFQLDEYIHASEETRLSYRYLDLRRTEMQNHIRRRAQLACATRTFLDNKGFVEVDTPLLTKATPEGARDYLTPSRLHPRSFYALPQSPQLFKQLLMMSGVDRYYQIARCFRDEDLRNDRQPEFTQIDIEASFVSVDDILAIGEGMVSAQFRALFDEELPPVTKMDYNETIRRFGCDKPDLRNPLELHDIADVVRDIPFKVFSVPAADDRCRVVALKVPQGAQLSRKQIDDYTHFVGNLGAQGLAWIKITDLSTSPPALQSPILKFIPEDVVQQLMQRVEAHSGDILFFGAGRASVVNAYMSALIHQLGKDLKLFNPNQWAPLWVVNFPLFQIDHKGERTSMHHPFTAPACDLATLRDDPNAALSHSYDMVLNGNELGGGSIRIHDSEMQYLVFSLLGIDKNEAQEKFGFFCRAMEYGCPPHGGIAYGFDRMAMLYGHANSIREVIAFPKTQNASCLITGAPAPVTAKQLHEIHFPMNTKDVRTQ